MFANNPLEVQDVIKEIKTSCSIFPTSTTISVTQAQGSSVSCSSQIKELSDDFNTFRTYITEQFLKINELMSKSISTNQVKTLIFIRADM